MKWIEIATRLVLTRALCAEFITPGRYYFNIAGVFLWKSETLQLLPCLKSCCLAGRRIVRRKAVWRTMACVLSRHFSALWKCGVQKCVHSPPGAGPPIQLGQDTTAPDYSRIAETRLGSVAGGIFRRPFRLTRRQSDAAAVRWRGGGRRRQIRRAADTSVIPSRCGHVCHITPLRTRLSYRPAADTSVIPSRCGHVCHTAPLRTRLSYRPAADTSVIPARCGHVCHTGPLRTRMSYRPAADTSVIPARCGHVCHTGPLRTRLSYHPAADTSVIPARCGHVCHTGPLRTRLSCRQPVGRVSTLNTSATSAESRHTYWWDERRRRAGQH